MSLRYEGLTTLLYDGMLARPTHGELISLVPTCEDDSVMGIFNSVAHAGSKLYLDDTDPLDRQLLEIEGCEPALIINRYIGRDPKGLGFVALNNCRLLIQKNPGSLLVNPESFYIARPLAGGLFEEGSIGVDALTQYVPRHRAG
jgi:hypothetical protein